jgi:hypothetical protein
VTSDCLIRQVTVNAFLPAMPCIVKPVLIFGFHDMATRAKLGTLRLCVKPRPAEAQKPAHRSSQSSQQDEFGVPFSSPWPGDVHHKRSRHYPE